MGVLKKESEELGPAGVSLKLLVEIRVVDDSLQCGPLLMVPLGCVLSR